MHAFFDRDVYIKIAVCDLWAEVLQALGVTHPYRLASASVSGASRPLKRMSLDEFVRTATLQRIAQMAVNVPIVPAEWTEDAFKSPLFSDMSGIQDIDAGEAILSIVAINCPHQNKLVSGDKRFIVALRNSFPDQFSALGQSLISFERCLLAVCDAVGFETVKGRLLAARGCDHSLKLSLGSDDNADEGSFREALISFSPV